MLIGLVGGILVTAVVFVVAALVPTLRQIQRTAHAVELVVSKVETQLDPTIHEAQGLVRDVSSLTRRIDGDMKVVSRIVEDVGDTTAYAKELAGLVKTEVERPVLGLISTIMGVRKGVDAYRGHREKNKAPRNPFRRATAAKEGDTSDGRS